MAAAKTAEEPKNNAPVTFWGKVLNATPVIMTVVATALAGLASSEMTIAQYSRSLAAQQQAKAGDQWSFFQAKKLRAAIQRSTLDVLQATTEIHPFDADILQLPAATLASPAARQALDALQRGQTPDGGAVPELDPQLKAALDAIESLQPESATKPIVAQVKDMVLEDALRAAKQRAQAFDVAARPTSQGFEEIQDALAHQPSTAPGRRDFTAARLRYTALRYDAEARLNQSIAALYEVRIRKSNADADRHHRRSQRFFIGMLCAQAAVIISTFAVAARQRNLLWTLAAAAGFAAIAFAVYVYLFV